MIALAANWSEAEGPQLLRWIVPASLALHVLAFVVLPNATRSASNAPLPLVISVTEPPPPPPPPEEPAPAPEETPVRAVVQASTNAPKSARTADPVPASANTAPTEAPMDFTSTVFSNDGPGIALGGGGGSASVLAKSVAPVVTPAAPSPVRTVPPASLARRPRAPGLDVELERQYPLEARRSGISGTAILRVRILPDGRIGEVHVVSESWTGFGPACERTVRGARWEPPIDRDGSPVATEITYTCRFEVRS